MFHNGFMGGMGYGWIFWIAIITFIVFLVLRFTNGNKSNRDIGTGQSSLELLKKRYAKGEISKEEYLEKKKDLS